MGELDRIAKKYGTDKSSDIHNYCEKYEKYIKFKREEKLNILEIGVSEGKSVKMWSEYFPNSNIVGLDILPECKKYEKNNIKIMIGSQDDDLVLKKIVDTYGSFDIIIDDGSHLQHHMLYSFNYLIDYLKEGGQYILEDTCCSYWGSHGGGFKKDGTSIEYFKNMVDDVNFRGILQKDNLPTNRREDTLIKQINTESINIRTDIESINFMNSIIILTKR
jgi:hypothetical protein